MCRGAISEKKGRGREVHGSPLPVSIRNRNRSQIHSERREGRLEGKKKGPFLSERINSIIMGYRKKTRALQERKRTGPKGSGFSSDHRLKVRIVRIKKKENSGFTKA